MGLAINGESTANTTTITITTNMTPRGRIGRFPNPENKAGCRMVGISSRTESTRMFLDSYCFLALDPSRCRDLCLQHLRTVLLCPYM